MIGTVAIGEGAKVGPVTNVDTINITGSTWESNSSVTNPETITVNGQVKTISSGPVTTSRSAIPGSLNVEFNQQADVNGFIDIGGTGTIGKIDFSNADHRPSLRYTPNVSITDENKGNIVGNSGKVDTLVLTGSLSTSELPTGFTGIEYPTPPSSTIPTNLRRLSLAGIGADAVIKAVFDETKSTSNTISIPFTSSGKPSEFYLKTAGTNYSIDFSSAERPANTTFEIAEGTVTKLNNGTVSKCDQLVLNSGTLEGDVSTMNVLSINGNGWTASGRFSQLNGINVLKGGTLTTLDVSQPTSTPPPALRSAGTLSVQTTSTQKMPVTVASGGTLTTLDAKRGASLGDITVASGGTLTTLNANESATLGTITGAETVDIRGKATLGPIIDAKTVDASTLAFKQVQVGSQNEAKTSATIAPNLVLNTPNQAVALTTKGIDSLELGSGAKLGATVGDVNNLSITGKDWSTAGAIPMSAKATVNIDQAAVVPQMVVTTAVAPMAGTTQTPTDLNITVPPTAAKSAQTLAVTTRGNTGSLDFSGVPDTTVNLVADGGIINGVITGADNITFNGVSELNGTIEKVPEDAAKKATEGAIEGSVKSVKIAGQLTTMSKEAVPAPMTVQGASITTGSAKTAPVMDIAKGGKLIINRQLNVVDGGYRQDGVIKVDIDSRAFDGGEPLVDADTITIGPNATLVFESSTESKDGQILMKAGKDAVINQPVKVLASNQQYHHYYAEITPANKNQMVLAAQPMGDFVGGLARAGGAPASAARALDVAVSPKDSTGGSAALSRSRTTTDLLNRFVVQRATTPASAAQLAKQLTPNNTGSNITAARGAQQMTSKAIDNRNTNRRTGMSSGNMMESGGVWIQYAYTDAKQDEKDGVYGYKDKTNGFTLGADWELDAMFDAGVAYTYAKSGISGEGVGSSMDSKNHVFTAYGSYTQDEMFVDGLISYASGDNSGHRSVSGNPVRASYDSNSWGIGLSGGVTLPTSDEWSWQPLAAFNYYSITTNDYAESATLNYLTFDKVKNDNYTIMELGAGVRLMGDIDTGDLAFRPAFKLMLLHDLKDDPVTMTAHYAAGGDSFVVHGAKRDSTRYQFAASVDMDLQNDLTLSFNYSHDWMDSFSADGFIARLRYDF